MAGEQTFRSPGFFEREIDLTQRQQAPIGVPAGVIGTAEKGPAFVPVTVGSFADFVTRFGTLDPKKFGPYAVNEWLKHRSALTYMRVLGAGANDTTTQIEATRVQGTVTNAGFVVSGTRAEANQDGDDSRSNGMVQFIVARHFLSASESLGFPVFTDNDSYNTTGLHTTGDTVNLVRGMVLMASGARLMVLDGEGENFHDHADDFATLSGPDASAQSTFKLVISSSDGAGFSTTDDVTGIRVMTASLNPSSQNYIGKVLNTNPERFPIDQHLFYADFAVENELAPVAEGAPTVAVASGSEGTSSNSGIAALTHLERFGRFDTRFTTPKTTKFISQPFGVTEYDLFHFESISDGAWANDKIKISIANIRGSTDPKSDFGTFAVQVRSFSDVDTDLEIIENFPDCSLDPTAENYIAAVVGDMGVRYAFDADQEDERRLVVTGKYPNRSTLVRVVVNQAVKDGLVPKRALPFGFRGPATIKTNDALTDSTLSALSMGLNDVRLSASGSEDTAANAALTGSIVPPLPYRFKVTRGAVDDSNDDSLVAAGFPGANEVTDSRFYWGVKVDRVPQTGSLSNAILNSNVSSVVNPLVRAYTKFMGIEKLDSLVTGSGADAFNDNKFTLARVAFGNDTVAQLTGTADAHMREAAYIRNGKPDGTTYTVSDGSDTNRITLATLVNQTSSVDFNRFSDFTKFTNIFQGGFDGFNILDADAARMNDKASSSDTDGGASAAYVSPGLTSNVAGSGQLNSTVFSYKTAARIMTDEFSVNTHLLAIPGIRDSFITDEASKLVRANGLQMFVMDMVSYDENLNRLFDDSSTRPDIEKTSGQFDSRALDNNYVATYFPDVTIDDLVNNRKVKVPASVAQMGAIAFNDKVSYPWFAPAGFNRAALDFVSNVSVRLKGADRDRLQDARINPIGPFQRGGGGRQVFAVFGQKTLQFARSALDRVNVRRLMLDVKRAVKNVADRFVFEQNTPDTRAAFVSQVVPLLAAVQAQSGIEQFKVVMDETNNTQQDIENNRLNGKIVVIPTRTVEFIAIDFIVTNAGVSFQ